MSKKKKKSGKVIQMPLSPENYIRKRARKLPLHECLINEIWQESGMATIIISRLHTNGYITYGIYLVDLFCLGVKDTVYQFNIPGFEFDQYVKEFSDNEKLISCDYVLAHNIIYGSLEFADGFGFKPHKDFTNVSKYILEEDNENVELMDIEFGKSGKPLVVAEIGNDQVKVISQLEKTAGPGNYDVIYIDENGFYEDDLYEEGDLDEEDFDEDFVDMELGKQLNLFEDEVVNNDDLKDNEPEYPKELEVEEWRKLFSLMEEIYHNKIWTWMLEYHIFAIRDIDTDTTGFVSVMGEMKEHTGITVYIGNEGIHGFWKLQDLSPEFSLEDFIEIPQIQASFEERAMLTGKDLKRIKDLGFKFRGRGAWPLIRSLHPGHFPWYPEPWERKFLCYALEQTLAMAKQLKKNPDLLNFDNENDFLLRIPEQINGKIIWKDSMINVPASIHREISVVIDREKMQAISNFPASGKVLEMDLLMIPSPVKDKEYNPYYVYALMALNSRTELIEFNQTMTPVPTLLDMYAEIPLHFSDMIINSGQRPLKVNVQTDLLYRMLKPLADDMGIKMEMVRRLPLLESAKKEMFGFIER